MRSRLLDDLAAILRVLAVAEERSREASAPVFDTNLGHARAELMDAARDVAVRHRRPDGLLRFRWVAAEATVMGVVAFGCAYLGEVVLELPGWLTVLTVIVGQVVLSLASLRAMPVLNARLRAAALAPDWPGRQTIPNQVGGVDVAALLTQARGMVGQLAAQRLDRVAAPIRSGWRAQWVGHHDRLLRRLHNADAHLCGARWAWTKFGTDVVS